MSIQRIKSGVIADSAVTAAKLDDSTSQLFGFRNRIINGDMMIDQRNAGASVTIPSGTTYTVDRWACDTSQASKFSAQQSSTVPTGFKNSILITSLSSYSVGASDYFLFRQAVEGLNFADLAWGTASAATVTLSFWVRSSLTGTFGGSLSNGSSRSHPFSYTISEADTWEKKTITIAGDTTGTWLTTTGIGIVIYFGLGVGSTYSGTASAWVGTQYLSATGATSVVGTNAATWYITGVQLEVGSVATPFERRPYGTEFMLCQRYYVNYTFTGSQAVGATLGYTMTVTSGNNYHINFQYPVIMRAAPTLTYTNWSNNNFPTGANFQSTGTAGSNVYKNANGTGVGWYLGGYTASAEL